jgi:hypothetical protein
MWLRLIPGDYFLATSVRSLTRWLPELKQHPSVYLYREGDREREYTGFPSHCGRAGCASHGGRPKHKYTNSLPGIPPAFFGGRVLGIFLTYGFKRLLLSKYIGLSCAPDFPQIGLCFVLVPKESMGYVSRRLHRTSRGICVCHAFFFSAYVCDSKAPSLSSRALSARSQYMINRR